MGFTNTIIKFLMNGYINPVFLGLVEAVTMFILFMPIVFYNSKNIKAQLKTNWKILIPFGIFTGLMYVFGFLAMNLVLSSYFISIKRTSILFTMLFGVVFFKERKNLKESFVGGLLMVAGAIAIILLG